MGLITFNCTSLNMRVNESIGDIVDGTSLSEQKGLAYVKAKSNALTSRG
jgi:hypothetical protein